MAQLDLLGYPAITVNHYDRKAAPVASSIEQAADMAAEHFGNEAIITGWCYDVLALYQRNRRIRNLLYKN